MRALTGAAAREAAVAALLGGLLGAAAAVALLLLGIPVPVPAGSPTAVVASRRRRSRPRSSVLAVVLATIVTIVELRAPVTGRAESGRAALIASLGPLLLAAVAAGLAYAQFVALGSPIVVRADGTVRTDPVALAAPMAVLVAAALAAPVIIGPLSLHRRAHRAGRPRHPARAAAAAARPSRALGGGGRAGHRARGRGGGAGRRVPPRRRRMPRTAPSSAATGADLRLRYAVRSTVGEGFPAASALDVAGRARASRTRSPCSRRSRASARTASRWSPPTPPGSPP